MLGCDRFLESCWRGLLDQALNSLVVLGLLLPMHAWSEHSPSGGPIARSVQKRHGGLLIFFEVRTKETLPWHRACWSATWASG